MTFRLFLSAVAIVLAGLSATPADAQTPGEIAAVQSYLAGLGYEPGPADGVMGGRTRTAIEQFEASRGQPVSGEVTDWLVALATRLAADSGGVGVVETEPLAAPLIAEEPDDVSPISEMAGDPTIIHGQGSLAFSDLADGGLLITDGLAWRGSITVAPRTLTIITVTGALFSVSSADTMPVPLGGQVVDIPGSLFVPLFLATNQASATAATLADAVGVTWRFESGGLRFDLDGYSLVAADPGASMTFTADGVELRGFELMPL
jgi:hypothetical protein